MAVTLKFMRGSTTLSLQDALSGLQLANDGWTPKIATPTVAPAGPVVETMQIIAQAASQDALAAVLQELHAMQVWSNRYWSDRDELEPVWLHAKMYSETGERRAMVHRIDAVFGTGWFDPETITNAVDITLTVEREPFWEDIASTTCGTFAISVLGSEAADYTAAPFADIAGDIPARLETMQLECYDNANDYVEHWIGFRSQDKHPMAADHTSLWELEDGTPDESDTTAVVDATASPGSGNSALSCTFANGEGWLKRSTATLADLGIAADDAGTFLMLLRAKNSDTTSVVEIQLRAGYPDNIVCYSEIAQITLDSYAVFNMGLLTLPFRDHRMNVNFLPLALDGSGEIQLWLRRLSGSASCTVDCVTAVPADEFLLHATGLRVSDANGLFPVSGFIGQAPEGHFGAVTINTNTGIGGVNGTFQGTGEVSVSGMGIPIGDGRLVVLSVQADGNCDIADTITVTPVVYPRWLSLRGGS